MNCLQRSSVNITSSAAGYVVPMLVNLIATPLLLRGLGEAAFGLQSLDIDNSIPLLSSVEVLRS
jgi:hypothetical protein